MSEESEGSSRSPLALVGLILGPLSALGMRYGLTWHYDLDSNGLAIASMAGVAIWMSLWWLTEAVPLAMASMLPMILFPLWGISSLAQTSANYGNPLLFLFLGGFLLALGIEETGLHRRVALSIVGAMGDNPQRVIAGFMIATAVLSMWMSNTATTLMLLPIGLSVLTKRGEFSSASATEARTTRNFATVLMLSIAYASSIGGFMTKIGTPTNVAFFQLYEESFPGAPEISFLEWMLLTVPIGVLMLISCWLLLAWIVFPVGSSPLLGGREFIQAELRKLGRISSPELRMGTLFLITAGLWIFREPVPGWGWAHELGWGTPEEGGAPLVSDTTVAMGMAILAFIVPRQGIWGAPLLEWKVTRRLPWGILLLFGGGLALADGMERTGLDKFLGDYFSQRLAGSSRFLMAGLTSMGITFFSELAANVSCVQMSMPILARVAQGLGFDPRLLMIPAAISASCAFMLPIGTPPNAIVYGTGHITMGQMAKAGLWLNLVGVFWVVLLTWFLGPWILGIDTLGVPEWAIPSPEATP